MAEHETIIIDNTLGPAKVYTLQLNNIRTERESVYIDTTTYYYYYNYNNNNNNHIETKVIIKQRRFTLRSPPH